MERMGRVDESLYKAAMVLLHSVRPNVRTVQSAKFPGDDIVCGKRRIALMDSGLDHLHFYGDIDMFVPRSMKKHHVATMKMEI